MTATLHLLARAPDRDIPAQLPGSIRVVLAGLAVGCLAAPVVPP